MLKYLHNSQTNIMFVAFFQMNEQTYKIKALLTLCFDFQESCKFRILSNQSNTVMPTVYVSIIRIYV